MLIRKAAMTAIEHPWPTAAEETSLPEFHQCRLVSEAVRDLELVQDMHN